MIFGKGLFEELLLDTIGTQYCCSATIWFCPKYRGKVLVGEVDMVAEGVIRQACKELDIEVIDMAVNCDHVHLFIKYLPKYSVSFIAKVFRKLYSQKI